jgi:hypothetical protein
MPVWRNPAAWFGLAALAIPIAVHLLARVRAHVIAFPSLRFIDSSRLAARSRRTLSDLPLLALRLLAILLAVAACADPLFLTAARRTAWGTRVSRAVVIDTSASMTRAQADSDATRAANRESHDALRTTVLRSPSVHDGVARAVAWLRTSPPSRREIVVISDFQPDTMSAAVLRDVPEEMGLRFVRVGRTQQEQNTDTRIVSARAAGTSAASGLEWQRAQVHLTAEATAVVRRTPVAAASALALPPPIAITPSDSGFTVAPFGVRVTVAPAERPAALAAFQAVLAEGAPAPTPSAHARTVDITLVSARRDGDTSASAHDAHSGATAARTAATDTATTTATATAPTVTATAAAPGTLSPIATPWMADVLQNLATDRALTDAIAANTVADATVPASPWRGLLADARGIPVLLSATRTREGQTRAVDQARQAGSVTAQPVAPEAGAALPTGPAGDAAQSAQASPPTSSGHASAAELVLLARVSASAPVTPLMFRSVLRALAGPDGVSEGEVRTIPESALAAWTRPAAEPSVDAMRNVEESDRRWLWGAVLVVLAIETWMRRDRQRTRPERVEVHERAA